MLSQACHNHTAPRAPEPAPFVSGRAQTVRSVLFLGLALSGIASSSAEAAPWVIEGLHVQTPARLAPAAPHRPVWVETLTQPGTAALSVHIRQLQLAPGDYLRLVTDLGEETLFTAADGSDFWTPAAEGSSVRLELFVASPRSRPSVRIDAWRLQADEKTESYYGLNDLVEIADAPADIYAHRGPVARVDVGTGLCTGFLISEDRLVTNFHCISTQAICDRTRVQFNFELDAQNQPTDAVTLPCDTLLQADERLDFAVLSLKGAPGRKWGWYTLSDRVPTGEQGTIIQHPNGRRKETVYSPNCALLGITDGNGAATDFFHQCDTMSGSSGAPVLDARFEVVGLHHWGGASRGGGDSANQAVRMDLVVRECQVCPR